MSRAHPLALGVPPRWVDGWGEDELGLFVELECGGAVQRMRWIPPGRFRMGSPESEAGRWNDEGPVHEVTLTRGFWLGDTPVTQGLWQAVMGKNPSRFQSTDRPVESVSFADCEAFLAAWDQRSPGLGVRLPSEAEWEYACRAGTTTSTYAGELQIQGENHGPVLDSIAWYGGNSGVEFDLAEGYDSAGWAEKQYPHQRAGTRRVKGKAPNAWGLYDMLGNVWEWCADRKDSFSGEDQADPAGPPEGVDRVLRGGSWDSLARYVRAAFRRGSPPAGRFDFVGFRLARGQDEPGQA